jgi:hypothetical protein
MPAPCGTGARRHASTRGHQAEIRAIGQADGVGFIVKRHGGQHRAKHLFLRQAVAGRHIAQQRGAW